MGHIKLASPIAHIWYFKGTSSTLSIILDVPPQALERIIYYALYLVKEVDKDNQKKTLKMIDELQKVELKKIEEDFVIKEEEINVNFEKQYQQLEKKIAHREQWEIAKQEVEFKKREQLKLLSNEQTDTKTKKSAYYERVAKIARSIKPFDVIEEDDYLFFKENNVADFLSVGMGSEVLYEILSNYDLAKQYARALELLNETKGEKRNKLLKKARVLEAFIKAKIDPKWIVLTVLPVIPPDLRPVVQLPGGKFATSDLNDFYRRVINRNNRLKQLIQNPSNLAGGRFL